MADQESGWAFESRIEPSELQIGHFVTQLDIPWSETRFPLQGVLIDTPEKKRWMLDHCEWVVISHVRSPNKSIPIRRMPLKPDPNQAGNRAARGQSAKPAMTGSVSVEDLAAVRDVYDSLGDTIRELAGQFSTGRGIDIDSAGKVVKKVAEAIEHHAAALVWLTRIKDSDNYTSQHCMNVSILSTGLAHALGWDDDNIELAGLAGLLHDLGKMKVDSSILNKPGSLTKEEFEIIKTHTTYGYELLRAEGGLPAEVEEAVLHHHERPDGQGYPAGLKGGHIPQLARVVGIVDAYDAITSDRVYDPARSHHDALGILWKERGRQFDSAMVETFTQYLGWVSPGTLVRLTDDRLALVLQARSGRGLLPLVRTVVSMDEQHELGEILDLAALRPESGDAELRVKEVLPDGFGGLDMRALTANFG